LAYPGKVAIDDPTIQPGANRWASESALRSAGYQYLRGIVLPDVRHRVLRELADLSVERAPLQVGRVYQRADMATLPLRAWGPAVRGLAGLLQSRVSRAGWVPNEATLIRYSGPGSGISPHRDGHRYKRVIAVVSMADSAHFEVVADRAGEHVLAAWRCDPGDVLLLRAPDLPGVRAGSDPRPLHRVRGPAAGTRISLTFRMDGRAAAG
jgi:alkylated DNA repair dioxygenase AlkB